MFQKLVIRIEMPRGFQFIINCRKQIRMAFDRYLRLKIYELKYKRHFKFLKVTKE